MDGYCRDLGIKRVDFIRMDIEGAEQKALEGEGKSVRGIRVE